MNGKEIGKRITGAISDFIARERKLPPQTGLEEALENEFSELFRFVTYGHEVPSAVYLGKISIQREVLSAPSSEHIPHRERRFTYNELFFRDQGMVEGFLDLEDGRIVEYENMTLDEIIRIPQRIRGVMPSFGEHMQRKGLQKAEL